MSNFILGLGISLIVIGLVSIYLNVQTAIDELNTDEFEKHELIESPLFLSWLGLISIISGIGMIGKVIQRKEMLKH